MSLTSITAQCSCLNIGYSRLILGLSHFLLYVLSQKKSARQSCDLLRPVMIEKCKNDPYNLHVLMQVINTLIIRKKSIRNEFAIFQENEQIGFLFKRILKMWTRTNKFPPLVFVDTFFIPIVA